MEEGSLFGYLTGTEDVSIFEQVLKLLLELKAVQDAIHIDDKEGESIVIVLVKAYYQTVDGQIQQLNKSKEVHTVNNLNNYIK